jgi:hypothetical protein
MLEKLPVALRTWSLRTIFLVSLLVFCLVPATIVGWVLYRSNVQTVDVLSEKIVSDVTRRIQIDTEQHLGEAHIVFNGLIQAQPNQAETLRARLMMQKAELFEQAAFSMTRMTPNASYMYFGNAQGEFLGVEPISQGASGLTCGHSHRY